MTRALRTSLLLALLIGGAGASAQPPRRFALERGPGLGAIAPAGDPSAVVSAELAFAKLARDKGQWTAFRETADKDAVMFVPQIVNAQAWLKKRADPAQPLSWQPAKVIVSCDASYALSTGPWHGPDGKSGTFITIWRKQKDGNYRWVLDWGGSAPAGAKDDAIEGKVAACPTGADMRRSRESRNGNEDDVIRMRRMKKKRDFEVVRIPDPPPASGMGTSADRSLSWTWETQPSGARRFTVSMRQESGSATVIDDVVAAEGASS